MCCLACVAFVDGGVLLCLNGVSGERAGCVGKRVWCGGGLVVSGWVARRWPALMVAGVMLGMVVRGGLGTLRAAKWMFAWDDVGVCVEEGAVL